MPFVSQAQRGACYAQANRDKKSGKKPAWDCTKWEKETVGKLPLKFCGAACTDGTVCVRECKNGKCWQHCKKK